jgi:hypothetical protein
MDKAIYCRISEADNRIRKTGRSPVFYLMSDISNKLEIPTTATETVEDSRIPLCISRKKNF